MVSSGDCWQNGVQVVGGGEVYPPTLTRTLFIKLSNFRLSLSDFKLNMSDFRQKLSPLYYTLVIIVFICYCQFGFEIIENSFHDNKIVLVTSDLFCVLLNDEDMYLLE